MTVAPGNLTKTQKKRLKKKEQKAKQKKRDRINTNATRESFHGGETHLVSSSSDLATIEVTSSTAGVDSAPGAYI